MDHQRRHTTNIPTRRHANAILHDLFSNLRQEDGDDPAYHLNQPAIAVALSNLINIFTGKVKT